VLSNGNLTVTNPQHGNGLYEGARATVSKSAGKKYFEVKSINVGQGNQLVGIAKAAAPLTYPGDDTNGYGFYSLNGGVYFNDVLQFTANSWGTNDNIAVAVDFTNLKVWFKKIGQFWNGSGSADPATNTGGLTISAGTYFPMVGCDGAAVSNDDVMTANFGATAFVGTVPTGFSAWDT
jgi:hypothetical protein